MVFLTRRAAFFICGQGWEETFTAEMKEILYESMGI